MKPDELKKLRTKLGLTQAELASILDVKTNTVYRWEAGILPITRMVELAVRSLRPARKRNARRHQ